jgi:excisionase family DNA binding protein
MATLGLHEAARYLHCHPEELRRRAKAGRIPGAKVGRAWVFLEDDLAQHIRSLYPNPRQALRVTFEKELQCHSASEARPGGSISSLHQENEYEELLELATKPRRKSFTTS